MTDFIWQQKPRIISVVVDNDSWILPYAQSFVEWCNQNGDRAQLCKDYNSIEQDSISFFLGCTSLAKKDILQRSHCSVLVHESALPQGKGFAPMTWQILEGKNTIPVCMLYATEEADAGDIIYKDYIQLDGTELCHEWRHLQGLKTVELCQKFLQEETRPVGLRQEGQESSYKRRTPADSKLDIDKSIGEQMNLLRTVDNERYPAFFEYKGQRYTLKIEKVK